MPLVIGRAKKDIFGFISEAVTKRVANWKNEFLSPKDNEVLIKSIISAMPVYAMSCLKIPSQIGKEIEQQATRIWWASEVNKATKIH